MKDPTISESQFRRGEGAPAMRQGCVGNGRVNVNPQILWSTWRSIIGLEEVFRFGKVFFLMIYIHIYIYIYLHTHIYGCSIFFLMECYLYTVYRRIPLLRKSSWTQPKSLVARCQLKLVMQGILEWEYIPIYIYGPLHSHPYIAG